MSKISRTFLKDLKVLLHNAAKVDAKQVDYLAIARFMQQLERSFYQDNDLIPLLGYLKGITDYNDSATLKVSICWLTMLLYECVSNGMGETYAQAIGSWEDPSLGESFLNNPGGNLHEKLFALARKEVLSEQALFTHSLSVEKPKHYDNPSVLVKKGIIDKNTLCWQLSKRHDLWCYRSEVGGLVLLSLVNYAGGVLIDEEKYYDETPQYFTETTHFESPVYHLTYYRKVFKSLMTLLGYPVMGITIKLIGVGERTQFVNAEEMLETTWKGQGIMAYDKLNLPQAAIGLTCEDYCFLNAWEDIVNCARIVFKHQVHRENLNVSRLSVWLKRRGYLC